MVHWNVHMYFTLGWVSKSHHTLWNQNAKRGKNWIFLDKATWQPGYFVLGPMVHTENKTFLFSWEGGIWIS